MSLTQAVAIIEEARKAHEWWIVFLRKDPTGGALEAPVEMAGDVEHHQRWVDNYDVVLSALAELPGQGDEP